MVIKTLYHFDDSNLGVEKSHKREVNRKIGRGDLEVIMPVRRQITYLGEDRVCLGDQGLRKTIQIN